MSPAAATAINAVSTKLIAFMLVMVLCSFIGMQAARIFGGRSKETRKAIFSTVTMALMVLAGHFFF